MAKEIMPGKLPAPYGVGQDTQAPTQKTDQSNCQESHIPELVKIEVANVEGQIVLIHDEPKEGSAIEAAAELHKLTELLTEKVGELKAKADQAFLGEAECHNTAHPNVKAQSDACETSASAKVLPSAVQEVVGDLCAEMKLIEPTSSEAVNTAEALDKMADVLEQSAQKVKDIKIELAAHELNSLDGFDR